MAGGLLGGGLWERVARRGGNYNNTSNAGVAYLNCNNTRSNSNVNNGGRPRSRTQRKTDMLRAIGGIRTGGARFRQSAMIENKKLDCAGTGGPVWPGSARRGVMERPLLQRVAEKESGAAAKYKRETSRTARFYVSQGAG